MKAGLTVCGILFCSLGPVAGGQSSARLKGLASVGEEKRRDERIGCIVRREIVNEGRFTSEFRRLLDESRHSNDLMAWAEERMSVETKYNRVTCTCRLPSGDRREGSPWPGLSLFPHERRYVEVLLAILISNMSRVCSSSSQVSLMLGSGEFPKILGERRFRSGVVRVLEQPAGYKTGFLSLCSSGRRWNGRVPLFRVELADREKLDGVGLLVALERSLARWSEEVERCGARRKGDRCNPGTSKVSLHLARKELLLGGYYKLREVRCLESGLEVRSVLSYNAYWDHLTLLRPLGRWLQGQATEAERGSFRGVSVESQDVGRGNVGSFMSYGEGCVRLYEGGDWMVVLLVDNDGTSGFFASDGALLEETLADAE